MARLNIVYASVTLVAGLFLLSLSLRDGRSEGVWLGVFFSVAGAGFLVYLLRRRG